jgi:hypothetical protein
MLYSQNFMLFWDQPSSCLCFRPRLYMVFYTDGLMSMGEGRMFQYSYTYLVKVFDK